MFSLVSRRCSVVEGSHFNKRFLPGTRRDGGAEPQSLVSVLNIPGLDPKSFHAACDVKAYVLLMAIRPPDGDVKPDSQFVIFEKIKLMASPDFP